MTVDRGVTDRVLCVTHERANVGLVERREGGERPLEDIARRAILIATPLAGERHDRTPTH